MIDFTSSLYLGLHHASDRLAPWQSLTTGKPAILEPEERTARLGRRLAALQRRESAVIAPSTLHLAWDLFGLLARMQTTLYVDAGTYSVLNWGVERAAMRGTPVRTIRHHDVESLRKALRRPGHRGRAVVVCDGFCPACGEAAPLADFARESDGLLVVDDTQALGVVGHKGGGAVADDPRIRGRVLVVASLAKGFGVPLAVLAGDDAMVDAFDRASETRIHSSPASTASLHAAAHALDVNDACGDLMRARLRRNVRRWKQGVRRAGIATRHDDFPVQTLAVPAAVGVQRSLARARIATAVTRPRCAPAPVLTFLFRATHSASEVDAATAALASAAPFSMRSGVHAHH